MVLMLPTEDESRANASDFAKRGYEFFLYRVRVCAWLRRAFLFFAAPSIGLLSSAKFGLRGDAHFFVISAADNGALLCGYKTGYFRVRKICELLLGCATNGESIPFVTILGSGVAVPRREKSRHRLTIKSHQKLQCERSHR